MTGLESETALQSDEAVVRWLDSPEGREKADSFVRAETVAVQLEQLKRSIQVSLGGHISFFIIMTFIVGSIECDAQLLDW